MEVSLSEAAPPQDGDSSGDSSGVAPALPLPSDAPPGVPMEVADMAA